MLSRLPRALEVVVLVAAALSAPCRAQTPADQTPADQTPPDQTRTEKPASFDLLEFLVEGNTVLDTEEIERAVYPSLGYQRTLNDVETARAALEARFQGHGFLTVSVTIPEQKVEGGLVHLRVLEGKVGRVRVTGSRYFDLGYIRERTPSVAEGSVPHFPDVQKDLEAINRSADRKVAPVLRVGRAPGTVDVDLKVDDHLPVHGSVELNNRSSQFTAPLRLSGTLRYDNLWQAEHSFGLTWQVAPQRPQDSNVLSATYLMPLARERSLNIYAVHSSSDVVPGAFDTIGKGNIVGLRYIVTLPGDNDLFHSLTLGIDHKQFAEAVRLQGQDASNTPITYVPFLLQYGGFAQDADGSTTQFALAANLASGGVFGNKDADFENKRSGATASYFALHGELARTQKLPGNWMLHARGAGQLSATPLISNEQISMGGAESIRGYREAEALGDFGGTLSLELRTPGLLGQRQGAPYLLLFIEGGNLKVRQPLAQQAHNYSFASEGLGLRLDTLGGSHLALDLAHVLRQGVYTPEGTSRVEFRLGQDF